MRFSKICFRILIPLLSIVMLYSCAPTQTSDMTTEPDELTAQLSTTVNDYFGERQNIDDGLPEADYGGYEFRIYHRDEFFKYIYADEIIGEVVNDAVYNANKTVEERFNIKITPVKSGLGDVDHVNAIKRIILAGDDVFDIAFGHDMLTPLASLEGYFYNLYDVPHLNFDKPWWSEYAMKEFTVLGQCYLGVSSMSYMGLDRARILYINEDMMKDYGIQHPYQDVLDGAWTLDKLITMTKNIYKDVNGDNIRDSGDIFGYITEGGCYGYLENFGVSTMEKDNEEVLVNGVKNSFEKMTSIIDKVYEWLINSDGAMMTDDANAHPFEEFVNKKLMIGHFELGEGLRQFINTDINYGIIPMPKYDVNQDNYYVSCVDHPMVIPNNQTEEQLDRTGMIIEAMSAEGYKNIIPAYFQTALKVKYFDDESVKMLDIIDQSKSMSFSFVYEEGTLINLSLYGMMCKGATSSPSNDFASYYEKRVTAFEKRISTIVEKFEDMKK